MAIQSNYLGHSFVVLMTLLGTSWALGEDFDRLGPLPPIREAQQPSAQPKVQALLSASRSTAEKPAESTNPAESSKSADSLAASAKSESKLAESAEPADCKPADVSEPTESTTTRERKLTAVPPV